MKRRTQIILLVVVASIVAALAYVFRAPSIPVQTVSIQRGHLQEIVEEEGKTRMHDHFVLASTVTGKLRRVDLHAGDRVSAGQTVAWVDPAPIDPRQNAILEARLKAAGAAYQQADAVAGRSQAEYEQAERDLERGRELYKQGVISKEAFDKAVTLDQSATKQLQAARSGVESAAYQVEEARSALLVHHEDPSNLPTAIQSPVVGRILRLIEQSERVVGPGTPVMEIGYTPRLEWLRTF